VSDGLFARAGGEPRQIKVSSLPKSRAGCRSPFPTSSRIQELIELQPNALYFDFSESYPGMREEIKHK
jgi:hypothetical protein